MGGAKSNFSVYGGALTEAVAVETLSREHAERRTAAGPAAGR